MTDMRATERLRTTEREDTMNREEADRIAYVEAIEREGWKCVAPGRWQHPTKCSGEILSFYGVRCVRAQDALLSGMAKFARAA